ncbi:uncharacterized protein At5g39865 [Argentina anserina]|uniref:uncharacterized protein At5g39865 n=1 Tax=Argentina anserina TaxID=57926 RepID=UPI0021768E4C|nr:uncharacterized protein At5g39865 [Potentilla anserina]
MGCASSKKSPRCGHCHNHYSSPVTRSYSMHVHHPPQNRGDSYHVVALTSSTLGSLSSNKIEYEFKTIVNDNKDHIHKVKETFEEEKENNVNGSNTEFSMGLIEAKTWSNMINQKIPKVIPKTPTRTPPGEPETINAWELMEGLEDISPLRNSGHHLRSFSFDVIKSPCPVPVPVCVDRPKSRFHEIGNASPKPMWLQLADNENMNTNAGIPQFDAEVISGFRKSFGELKVDDPFHFRDGEELSEDISFHFGDRKEEELDDSFYRKDREEELKEDESFDDSFQFSDETKEASSGTSDYKCEVSFGKGKDREKVMLYFTSLRGVRKTYEDCCHVRVILKGIGVRVDERDVSMHSGFKEELKDLVRDGCSGVSLPKVFVGEKYIGGAEEIRQMHEDGKLEKLLESCEKLNGGGGGGGGVCEACGDIRFVPCETCSGSCKIYYEDDEDRYDEHEGEDVEEEEEEAMEGECGFQRCPDCNENGLTRCPICCY